MSAVVDVADNSTASTEMSSKEDPQFLRKRSVQMEEEGVTSPPGTATAPAGSPEKETRSKRENTSRKFPFHSLKFPNAPKAHIDH